MMSHTSPTTRDGALDFTKGILVLLMVLYHACNYFMHDRRLLIFLTFLAPAFILITGFIVTRIYPHKYGRRERSRITRRLLVRGIKLLALFTALNILVNLLFSRNYNGAELGLRMFFGNSTAIYLLGSAQHAAFEVLVPIAYLLLISPLVLLAAERQPLCVWLLWGIAFFAVLALPALDIRSYNLTLVCYGLLGAALGNSNRVRIGAFRGQPAVAATTTILYFVVIHAGFSGWWVKAIGVCAILSLIYFAGTRLHATRHLGYNIVLLGQYSLLSYVFQIAALQILFRLLGPLTQPLVRFSIALFAALISTWLCVSIVAWLRPRFRAVDIAYRLVFA